MSVDALLPVDSRLRYIDSLLSCDISQEERIKFQIAKGSALINARKFNEAILTHKETLRKSDESLSESLRLRILSDLLTSYLCLSDYNNAVEMSRTIIETPKADSLSYYDGLVYLHLSEMFLKLKRYDLVESNILSALKNADESEDKNVSSVVLDNIRGGAHASFAILKSYKNDFGGALEELSQAGKYVHDVNSELCLDVNRGLIYSMMGENDNALECYYNIIDRKVYNFNTGVAINNAIYGLVNQNRFAEAVNLFLDSKRLTEPLHGDIMESYLYQNLSNAYKGLGNRNESLAYLKISKSLQDSINSRERDARLRWQTSSFMESQKAKENYMESDKIRKSLWGITLLLALVWMIYVIAVLIIKKLYDRERLKQKKNLEFLSNVAIIDKDVKKVDDTIEIQSRELTSLSMRLAQTSESIHKALVIIDSEEGSPADKVKDVRDELNNIAFGKSFWDEFNLYFGSVNASLLNKLYSRHPELTKGESRLCIFIYLGMSNKEIASITGRAVRSVESEKYRIRKKMGTEESLDKYLHTISTES